MLLEQALEIIEYTDSDQYEEAIDMFNQNHIINGSMLPFLNVIFEIAPEQLCKRLKSAGFTGDVSIAKSQDCYFVFNAARMSEQEAAKLINQ
ncbi:hypothetical protein [Vibrio sp. HN007]|uniref:hypothetical protein n=1 Tax=Vibrio iocasae TaxID=3098914 RepID=UPI0035D3E981